ncbi:MAG: hypothetical protein ABEJ69_04040 [Candidatus Nanohaloarchaea archaeon]
MAKFWGGVVLVFVLALALLAVEGSQATIDVTDLETECRYDRGEQVNIQLQDRQLYFEGYFPVNNPDASMSYGYSKSGERVVLNVKSSRVRPPQVFRNDCLGSAVYKAHTGSLEPGEYTVIVEHNGREAKKQMIEVR